MRMKDRVMIQTRVAIAAMPRGLGEDPRAQLSRAAQMRDVTVKEIAERIDGDRHAKDRFLSAHYKRMEKGRRLAEERARREAAKTPPESAVEEAPLRGSEIEADRRRRAG